MKITINKGLMSGCVYDTSTKQLSRQNSGKVIPKDGGAYLLKVNGKVVRITQVQVENYIQATKGENYQHFKYILSDADLAELKVVNETKHTTPLKKLDALTVLIANRDRLLEEKPEDEKKKIASIKEELKSRVKDNTLEIIKSIKSGKTALEISKTFSTSYKRVQLLSERFGLLLAKSDQLHRLHRTMEANRGNRPKRGRPPSVQSKL